MHEIARHVAVIPTLISNAYLVGDASSWILVDALTPGKVRTIKQAVEARFGPNAKPRAIVLTHGHFDHAGSAASLADLWGVKVYAHRLEHPYLKGESAYPRLDYTAPGFFSALSRLFPSTTVNLGHRLAELKMDEPPGGIDGWQCIFTPGHTPGHTAFFHRNSGTIVAGDAVTTMNLDSVFDTLLQRQELCRPPIPATTDWEKARSSVQLLASLRPVVIGAGHGNPMSNVADDLKRLAENFPIPPQGRYVKEPARADERGVTYLPPPPFDPAPKRAAVLAGAALIAGIGTLLLRRQRTNLESQKRETT